MKLVLFLAVVIPFSIFCWILNILFHFYSTGNVVCIGDFESESRAKQGQLFKNTSSNSQGPVSCFLKVLGAFSIYTSSANKTLKNDDTGPCGLI